MCSLGVHLLQTNHLRVHVKSSLTSERTDVSIMDLHYKVGYPGISSNLKSHIWRQKENVVLLKVAVQTSAATLRPCEASDAAKLLFAETKHFDIQPVVKQINTTIMPLVCWTTHILIYVIF